MKHFGIYTNSGDVQTALNEETLINPYVAKVSGSLDYNSIQPVGPCYLGEWSDDGAGNYTFQILDAEATAWSDGIQIGTLLNVYFNGSDEPIDMPVKMTFDGSRWNVEYVEPNESSNLSYQFEEGVQDNWTCDEVMTDPNSSTAQIQVEWDGVDTFVFFQSAPDEPDLSMNTVNPECETEPTPEPEPTCEEQGLCDDGEGNCVECDPGEDCGGDPECECAQMGADYYWNPETETCDYMPVDPCGGDPECECYQQGPDWSWNGEECIYTDPNESGPEESE